jgi:hypothetical protein
MYNFKKAEGKGRWNPAVYSHAALRGKQDLRCILELRPRTRTGKQSGLTASGSGSDLAESASATGSSFTGSDAPATAAAAAAAAGASSSSSSALDNSNSSSGAVQQREASPQRQQVQQLEHQQQDDTWQQNRWDGPEGGSNWGTSTQVRTLNAHCILLYILLPLHSVCVFYSYCLTQSVGKRYIKRVDLVLHAISHASVLSSI